MSGLTCVSQLSTTLRKQFSAGHLPSVFSPRSLEMSFSLFAEGRRPEGQPLAGMLSKSCLAQESHEFPHNLNLAGEFSMLLFFQVNGVLAFILCILKKSEYFQLLMLAVCFGSYLLIDGSGHDQVWNS